MFAFFKRFKKQEDGAVTVDWVVLTAAVAGLSIFIVATLRSDSNDLSGLTGDYLSAQDPAAAAGRNIQDIGVNGNNSGTESNSNGGGIPPVNTN